MEIKHRRNVRCLSEIIRDAASFINPHLLVINYDTLKRIGREDNANVQLPTNLLLDKFRELFYSRLQKNIQENVKERDD